MLVLWRFLDGITLDSSVKDYRQVGLAFVPGSRALPKSYSWPLTLLCRPPFPRILSPQKAPLSKIEESYWMFADVFF